MYHIYMADNPDKSAREEKEAYSTKEKAPCVEGVYQETKEVEKNSKVDHKQK
jgi:hypothetical protein